MLLADAQTRFRAGAVDHYAEQALQIQSPQGLAALGGLTVVWDPETDVVTVHKAHVVRGGRVIDLLAAGQSFTVLRREQNLEASMLDGQLTATLQPEGLQVGDVIRVAYTLTRTDPVLGAHSEQLASVLSPLPTRRLRYRALWPKEKSLRWRATDGVAAPRLSTVGSETELVVEMTDATAPEPPALAPARFAEVGQLELSDYSDWSQVSTLMAPYYARATVLGADSPLRAELQTIRAASRDPKVRAAAALRLVQDRVRYVYQGMNNAGYVPAGADETWSRRFGDCKGKTVLLLALLRELGVEAEPALVSVEHGDGLDARLPMLAIFDHVLVRAVVGGKVYWLDPTRQGDGGLDLLRTPDYGWALPVRPAGSGLERLSVQPLERPDSDLRLRVDASGGLFAPAPVQAEAVLRGEAANVVHLGLSGASAADAEEALKSYWSEQLEGFDIKTVASAYDPATGEARLSMTGTAKLEWTPDGDAGAYHHPVLGRLGWKADFKREPGPHAAAPFAVSHPSFDQVEQVILLPRAGEGFSAGFPDVDKTLAGVSFKRSVRLDKGVFTVRASARSVAPEFPAGEAAAAQAGLRALAGATVFIRAPSVYQPTAQDLTALRESTPVTAQEFIRRGLARVGGGESQRAMEDFNEAVRLEPALAWPYAVRARAHLEAHQMEAALADANKAVDLDPAEVQAHLVRGIVHLIRRDGRAALPALDAAAKLKPSDPQILARKAAAHVLVRDYDEALQAAADAIRLDPKPPEPYYARVEALQAKGDREAAAAELEKVYALHPRDEEVLSRRADFLNSLGRRAEALESYTASLAIRPTVAAYLGRAQARGEGQRAQQFQDVELAEKLEPGASEPALVRAKLLIADREFEKGLQLLDAAQKRGADEVTTLRLRIPALVGLERYDLAIAARDRVNSLRPDNPQFLNESCWLKATRSDAYEAALADCNRSLALNPSSAATLDSRGFTFLRLNRLDDAIKDFDSALRLNAEMAGSFYARGVAKRRKGDVAGSDADLGKARSLSPDIDARYKGYGLTP